MTTYRAINETEVKVDAPITQQLKQALKDNLISVLEGDDSAPKMDRDGLRVPTAGEYAIKYLRGAHSGADGTETIISTFDVLRTGTYRVLHKTYMQHSYGGGSTRRYVSRFYLNGVEEASLNINRLATSGSWWDAVEVDLSLTAGDTIYLTGYVDGGTVGSGDSMLLFGVANPFSSFESGIRKLDYTQGVTGSTYYGYANNDEWDFF